MNDYSFIPNSFQTPNAYVDVFMALLTSEEYKVLSYAVRCTFGFNKNQDRISLSQFVSGKTKKDGTVFDYGTGLNHNTVKACLLTLKQYGLLIELEPASIKTNTAALYTLQLNIEKVDIEGLKARLEDKKNKRSRKPPTNEPIPSGDTGIEPIPSGDTGYVTAWNSPMSSGDTTKHSINTYKTQEKGANASLSDKKVVSKPNPSNRYGIQEKVYTPDQQAALDFYRAVAGDGYADNPSNKIEVVEYTSKYGLAWFKAGIKEMQRNRVGLSAWRYFNSIMVNWKAEGRDAEGNPPAKAQPIDFKQAQQQRTSVQEMLASMPEEYRFKREPRVQAF